MNYSALVEQSRDLEKSISFVIDRELRDNCFFEARTFYAEAFMSAYLSKEHGLNNKVIELFSYALTNNSENNDFHWEFVVLAVLLSTERDGIPEHLNQMMRDDEGNLKFKGTDAVNWFLMRQLCTIIEQPSSRDNVLKAILKKFQEYQSSDEVLFEDQKNDQSHQYHSYIVLLLIKINTYLNSNKIKKLINAGTTYLLSRQFENGRVMYRGRGQEQIFGYGCYLYILAYAFCETNDELYLDRYANTLSLLQSFQTDNLGLPLVLNEFQKVIPLVPDLKLADYVGWYSYNNHFDYLAFFLYHLSEANQLLKTKKFSAMNAPMHNKSNYQYQFEPGSKLFSNDISFPLIFDAKRKDFVTSVMGGEQYSPSINSEKDLCFPYVRRFTISLWSSAKLIYKSKTTLVYITFVGIIIRKICPQNSEITVVTKVISPFKISLPIIVSEWYANFLDLERFKFDGFVYTPIGKFLRYYERGRFQSVTFWFEK